MNELAQFQETMWEYYRAFGRDLPWRKEPFDPYKILVSEIMLQQTQASRVIPKYQSFLEKFPTAEALAKAPLSAVLTAWSGLGYNRRAKFLWQAVQQIGDTFPQTIDELVRLPGIGHNTAGAIMAYAFNQPIVFIETNIRTVYIHHFFNDRDDVHDKELKPLIEATLDWEHPREWYWALMDYGSHLKSTLGNLSRSSKHYAKQSRFEGSRRQIRGQLIKLLTERSYTLKELSTLHPDDRLKDVIADLEQEQIIHRSGQRISL